MRERSLAVLKSLQGLVLSTGRSRILFKGSCHLPTPDKVHGFCLFLLSSKQPIGGGGCTYPTPPPHPHPPGPTSVETDVSPKSTKNKTTFTADNPQKTNRFSVLAAKTLGPFNLLFFPLTLIFLRKSCVLQVPFYFSDFYCRHILACQLNYNWDPFDPF